MRIAFVYPNLGGQVGFPYGAAHLSALARRRGHETLLFNLNERLDAMSDEEFLERIRKFDADVIGFSIVTVQWPEALRLARLVRERTDATTIAGGVHVTMRPLEVLESGAFDYAFVGEAEGPFEATLERFERGEDAAGIPGVWSADDDRDGGGTFAPLPDLRALPMPDYEFCDFQALIDARDGWVGLLAGRGCPFRCSYCFNHRFVDLYRDALGVPAHGLNYIRTRAPRQVLDEMRYLLERYRGVRTFIFDDDIFTLERPFMEEFLKLYAEAGAPVPLVVNAHVKLFDLATARALRDANCRIVKFGLESGSSGLRRRVLRRYMSDAAIERAFAAAAEAGLHTSAFVMLGLPYETVGDLRATVKLLAKIRPGRFRWSVFYPFVGTEAHRMACEGGFIVEEKMESLRNFFTESPLDFGPEQNLLVDKLNAAYPWFVNAEGETDCARVYRPLVKEIMRLDAEAWAERKPRIEAEDAEISAEMVRRNVSHYAVRYNRFMGVRSDYFLSEDSYDGGAAG